MPRSRRGLIASVALAAALAGLSLPRAGLWVFAWIGLAPLFVAANAAHSWRKSFLAGFSAGFAYHAVVLHWIYATCRFAQIQVPIAALAWFALAGALGLNWAAVAVTGSWVGAKAPRSLRPWIWGIIWTGVAAASADWTPRLAADLLAYTQWPNQGLIQVGSWGGPHLLGFVIVLVNAALAEAWIDAPFSSSGPAVAPIAASFALVAGLWAHGQAVLISRPIERGKTSRVEILQPNIDQYHKWDAAFILDIRADFEELLSRPGPAPAFVVWPETSLPQWTSRGVAPAQVARWAMAQKAEHLVGVVALPGEGLGPTNSVQLIAADGRVAGFYAKREIVPFGEYVPLRRFIPRFVIEHGLGILDSLGDMSPGPARQPLLATPFGPTAATICYEAVFPRWVQLDASRGATVLVNVTNDGWYKNTWGPYQHFGANIFRAIENRMTVIRSGNTGISAVIDPWGGVTGSLGLGERGRLDVDVPLVDPFRGRSFYSRHGDWFGMMCLILTGIACLCRALVRCAP